MPKTTTARRPRITRTVSPMPRRVVSPLTTKEQAIAAIDEMIDEIGHLLPRETHIVRRGRTFEVRFVADRDRWTPRPRGKRLLDRLPSELARELGETKREFEKHFG